MSITCKVIKKVEAIEGDELDLEFPDGQVVSITACADDDLDALKVGAQYSIAFVPFVPVDHPAAVDAPPSDAVLCPVEHPVVIEPLDANDVEPAIPVEEEAPATEEPAEEDDASAAVAEVVPEPVADPAVASVEAVADQSTPAK